jgi:hypothetical protein
LPGRSLHDGLEDPEAGPLAAAEWTLAWAAATSNPPARASGYSDGLRGHPASGGRAASIAIEVYRSASCCRLLSDPNRSALVHTGVIVSPDVCFYPVSLDRFVREILDQEFRDLSIDR